MPQIKESLLNAFIITMVVMIGILSIIIASMMAMVYGENQEQYVTWGLCIFIGSLLYIMGTVALFNYLKKEQSDEL